MYGVISLVFACLARTDAVILVTSRNDGSLLVFLRHWLVEVTPLISGATTGLLMYRTLVPEGMSTWYTS